MVDLIDERCKRMAAPLSSGHQRPALRGFAYSAYFWSAAISCGIAWSAYSWCVHSKGTKSRRLEATSLPA